VAIDHSEDVGEQVGEQVEEAARKARPWVDRIARVGYVAKGTVYATVGILAGQVALGITFINSAVMRDPSEGLIAHGFGSRKRWSGSVCSSENPIGPLTADSFTRCPNHLPQIAVVVGHEVREAHSHAGWSAMFPLFR